MGLSFAQIQAAISYNQVHAMDALPAIEREVGRTPSPPGRGWWNVQAVECIANLQAAAGLNIDGQFGPRTRVTLCEQLRCYSSEALWSTAGRDEREHWSALCEVMGYPLTEGRHSLVALRGLVLDAAFTHPLAHRAAYDDSFVWIDADGTVRRFVGATHPYQAPGEVLREDDRDEVATIRPGRYRVRRAHEFNGHPALDLFNLDGTNLIPARFERSRRIATETISELPTRNSQLNPQGVYTRGIMFHPGFDTIHEGGPFSSLGSQTAALHEIERMHEAEMFDFMLLDSVDVLLRLGRIA